MSYNIINLLQNVSYLMERVQFFFFTCKKLQSWSAL